MVELIVGTYGLLCWLLFKKFKVIPVTTYTIVTAFLGGGVILLLLYILLFASHRSATTAGYTSRSFRSMPNVRGTVIESRWRPTSRSRRATCCSGSTRSRSRSRVDRLRAGYQKREVLATLEQLAVAEATTKQARAPIWKCRSPNSTARRTTSTTGRCQGRPSRSDATFQIAIRPGCSSG